MHISKGQLRAYLDHQLDEPEQRRTRAHLSACARCRDQAEALSQRAGQVELRMAAITPRPVEAPRSVTAARVRLHNLISEKERTPMIQKLFARPYRPAWAALAIVVLLAVAFAFPGVRAIAGNFLGLFRVEQITLIPISEDATERLGASEKFQSLFNEEMQSETIGEYHRNVADAAEASALASIPVRLPTEIEGVPNLQVEQGIRLTLSVDLPLIREIMQEVGRADIQLPEELDRATITLEIPQTVVANYGQCQRSSASSGSGNDPDDRDVPWRDGCTTLMQVASPTITAPPNLDVVEIGEAFLQLMGLSASEAEQISRTVDWTTTLVVPLPTYYGASYLDVMVDGVKGTLITQSYRSRGGRSHSLITLLWVKDGVIYCLSHPGYTFDALAIANSLK